MEMTGLDRLQIKGVLGCSVALLGVLAVRAARRQRLEGTAEGDGAVVARIVAKAKAAGEPREIARRVLDGGAGKWLQMAVCDYATGSGLRYQWEYVQRPTRPPGAVADGVEVVALAHSAADDFETSLVVVLQFRPPVGKVVVELPAGLVDAADLDVVVTARRELLEETGYTAGEQLGSATPALHTAPWLTTESCVSVTVSIDLDDPRNKNPQQRLEGPEEIEVALVPLSQLASRFRAWSVAGLSISQHVWFLAMGMGLHDQGLQVGNFV